MSCRISGLQEEEIYDWDAEYRRRTGGSRNQLPPATSTPPSTSSTSNGSGRIRYPGGITREKYMQNLISHCMYQPSNTNNDAHCTRELAEELLQLDGIEEDGFVYPQPLGGTRESWRRYYMAKCKANNPSTEYDDTTDFCREQVERDLTHPVHTHPAMTSLTGFGPLEY